MKKLLGLILLLAATLLSAQEIRRPTTATTTGTWTNLAYAYDADANSSAYATSSANYASASEASATFQGWQSPSGSYSRLRLNMKVQCDTSLGDACGTSVSLDGGTTWATFQTFPPTGDFGLTTWSQDIPPDTNLANIRVQTVAYATRGENCADPPDCTETVPPTRAKIIVYDVWTEGWLGATPSPVVVRPTASGGDPTNYSQFCWSQYYNHFGFNGASAYDTNPDSYATLHTNYSGVQYQTWADTGWVGIWQTKPNAYAEVLKYKARCSGYDCSMGFTANSGTNWRGLYIANNNTTITNSIILDSNQSLAAVLFGACSRAYNYTSGDFYLYDVWVEAYPQIVAVARRRLIEE